MMSSTTEDATARIRAATVHVVQANGGGTGFFVAPRLVATCAHVLFNDGRVIPSWVEWRGHRLAVDFVSVLRAADDDLALIEVPVTHDDFVPLSADLRIGDALYAWGHPDDHPGGDSVTFEYEGPTRSHHPLLKFKGGQVRPGMSGAPVVNRRTGAVCALITTTRDRRSSLGGRGVPTATLQALLPTGPPGIRGRDLAIARLADRFALVRDELRTRRVPGSTRLTVADLLRPAGLLMPFRARASGRGGEPFDPLRLVLPDGNSLSYLVLAPPGAGKSTFAYALFDRLSSPLTNATPTSFLGPVPFLIDLRDYREQTGDPNFGSRSWLRQRLDEVPGAPGMFAWSGISDETTGEPELDAFIILDSLDELLAGQPLGALATLLSRFIFRRANVMCCRTQFYERYLSAASPFAHSKIMELQLLADADLRRYVDAYYQASFPKEWAQLASRFVQRLDTSADLVAVCRVALCLNMALGLLSPGMDDIPEDPDLLALYHAYLTGLLRSEAGKPDSLLSAERKLRLLEELAWYFYDEGNMAETEAPPFTELEFDRFLAQYAPTMSPDERVHVAEDLRSRSVLHVDGGMFSSVHPGTMSFVHKSFQEYLVARWLYNAMTTSAADAAEAFRQYMSPEVDEFLKEYLNRTRGNSRLLGRIAKNCMAALLANETPHTDAHEQTRARMAREQLGYFLGNINLPSAVTFLEQQLDRETDPWLRRGITCGLAIGGREEYLHAYVERLRTERESPLPHVENGVNLGFHLSFFGDQQFDPQRPEYDQDLPNCARTLRRLVYQLSTEVDRGAWRLNLYTLIDLHRNRLASRESSRRALLALLPQLRPILSTLEDDLRCRDWPEVAGLRVLISQLAGPPHPAPGV